MPVKTPLPVVKRIVKLRWRKRLGPVQIVGDLGVAPSTVHAVLARTRITRLLTIHRVTGEPLRRYEHDHPGALLHVDGPGPVSDSSQIEAGLGSSDRIRAGPLASGRNPYSVGRNIIFLD